MRALLPFALLCLVFASTPAAAKHLIVRPVDEAAEIPALKAARDALLAAVKRRDVKAVVAAASPDILLSFGEDQGPETFRAFLTGKEDWQGEAYFKELERVLTFGGTLSEDRKSFYAPYAYDIELPPEASQEDAVFILGEKVRLRSGAGTQHAVVRQLDWEVVHRPHDGGDLLADSEGRQWLEVETLHNERGWVASPFWYTIYDYRAGFELRDGRWQMIFFVAGD